MTTKWASGKNFPPSMSSINRTSNPQPSQKPLGCARSSSSTSPLVGMYGGFDTTKSKFASSSRSCAASPAKYLQATSRPPEPWGRAPKAGV
eukprot:CAMPEP_0198611332 /NCGR_PEP_ID=MMETSP1462-20131121/157345_1 /TAXON_ID=1333877 /ORGANISM="Brandtodinium nutriculum, Strain RCC3387" /LENGTH=90 /DNA_ID=CAMNT_0044343137 /DNA_START=518 /DNA_END=787 /DNA_ORIENTATION=-